MWGPVALPDGRRDHGGTVVTRILAALALLLCAAGLAAYATTHTVLTADAYDYGDPND